MVPPSRMRWVALVSASSMMALPDTLATVSMASIKGIPALSSTLRVRQVRARMPFRIRAPNRGSRSFI